MENETYKPKDWRQLCAIATNEDDPVKLASLVSQILQVFEEHDQTRLSIRTRAIADGFAITLPFEMPDLNAPE
jgi:hypothetical protein